MRQAENVVSVQLLSLKRGLSFRLERLQSIFADAKISILSAIGKPNVSDDLQVGNRKTERHLSEEPELNYKREKGAGRNKKGSCLKQSLARSFQDSRKRLAAKRFPWDVSMQANARLPGSAVARPWVVRGRGWRGPD